MMTTVDDVMTAVMIDVITAGRGVWKVVTDEMTATMTAIEIEIATVTTEGQDVMR